jgi:methionyl-tRNA formyltransferase
MKIVVFGSSDITQSVAEFLYKKAYRVVAIVTTTKTFNISYNTTGGVKNTRFVDMHTWGEKKQIPVLCYENIDHIVMQLQEIEADVALVVGWYHMVPQKLRALFSQGCFGFHASLLPQLRGGAPLNWAILLGLKESGVTFFALTDGVDEGLVYAQERFSINPDDYIIDMVEKSIAAVLKILENILPQMLSGSLIPFPQKGRPSYCGQRIPEDGFIDWRQSAEDILRLIKASSKPYPGAYGFLNAEKVIIWAAKIAEHCLYGAPGQIMVIEGQCLVVCGQGALLLTEIESKISIASSNHKRFRLQGGVG